MRKIALALVALAAFGATSNIAFAATTTSSSMASSSSMMVPAKPVPAKPAPLTVTGKITAADAKACTVMLDNKVVYHFGAKCKIGSLKVGESVTITYKVSGKTDWVTKIVVAKA
jgi:Protein of unknown function (DUF1344)